MLKRLTLGLMVVSLLLLFALPTGQAQAVFPYHLYLPALGFRLGDKPLCPSTTDLLVNGDFESGLDPWFTLGQVQRVQSPVKQGAYALRLGGTNNALDLAVQYVTVPAWATTAVAYLSWYLDPADNAPSAGDELIFTLSNNNGPLTGTVIPFTSPRGAWYRTSLLLYDPRPYRGELINLTIGGLTDKQQPGIWYVDHVQLFFLCETLID